MEVSNFCKSNILDNELLAQFVKYSDWPVLVLN